MRIPTEVPCQPGFDGTQSDITPLKTHAGYPTSVTIRFRYIKYNDLARNFIVQELFCLLTMGLHRLRRVDASNPHTEEPMIFSQDQ